MKTIQIFGSGIRSLSSFITAQRRLNCFFDIRPDGDPSPNIVRGTPGSAVFTAVGDMPIRGWRVIQSLMYVVSGSTVFTVDGGGNVTTLGTIATSSGYVAMADDAANLIIADGGTGYIVALPSGAPLAISDANFPVNCTSLDVLNSTMYAAVPNSRQFNASQKLSAGGWSPLTFGTKENTSDLLVAIYAMQGALVLFGEKSLEFWQDIGLSPLAVSRISGASQDWGLAAKYSVARSQGSLIFLGQNPQGGVQVMMLNGYTPHRISNSDVENKISSFSQYTDGVALSYVVDGHQMYQLTFPNAQTSFLYDGNTGMWYETQTGVNPTGRHFANLGIVFNSKNYVSDTSTGSIYRLDTSIYTDTGTPIKRQVVSRHIRMQGNEFTIGMVKLEMDVGVGLSSGQGSDPQVILRISRDGGKTWGPERWRSIGQGGQYSRTVKWDQCGSARDAVLEFTLTDPVKFIITQADAIIIPGEEIKQ